MNWFQNLFRHPDAPDEPVRAKLDTQQQQIASRLSKLTGKKRDDVLAEAYREADAVMGGRRES